MATLDIPRLLPLPQLEQQLSAIMLLQSMFSLPGEIKQVSSNTDVTALLQLYVENPSSISPLCIPSSADFTLNILVDPEHELQLLIRYPLDRMGAQPTDDEDMDTGEPPLPTITFRCPSWMNKKAYADIVQRMPVDSPDSVLVVTEFLKEQVADYLISRTASTPAAPVQTQALVRVWFYLQSLSTRSKRDDMVGWAPHYGLTGFVLAGKPGILCLEGTSDNISAYMSEIKTKSWSDIPPHQKKVSERYREEGPNVKRVLVDMREVTGEISKGGHRGNRGEMGEVKIMFERLGLGEVFAEVLGL
jgi:hypothetical protein